MAGREQALHEEMMRQSCAYRFSSMNPPLRVDGVPFNLTQYPFLVEPYDDEESPDTTIMKGAQLGWTTLMVLRTIDRAGRLYPRGVLYLFPTRDDVTDFSKTRFSRILEDNPALQLQVKGTDAANVKQIGDAFVYFRGAKMRSGLKSIPVDCLVFDEFDEMDEDMVALARERISGSRQAHEFKLSTPTIPEFGVDFEYSLTDKRRWMIKCEHCSGYTCLETDFPDCIRSKRDGSYYRACKKCEGDVFSIHGRWVAEYRKREKRGYHVSQLNSPTVNLKKIMEDYRNPRTITREFYNSKLGLPYADIDQVLDDAAILACCKDYPKRLSHDGPCFAGLDVGQKQLYLVIGTRRSENFGKIQGIFRVTSFDEARDLSKGFNVETGVADLGAEARGVRDFMASVNGWWGCLYDSHRKGSFLWDPAKRQVAVNRTESLDWSHKTIVQKMVEFPRPDELFRTVVMPQFRNIARVQSKDRHGDRVSKWVNLGRKNDDFRHAYNLAMVAMGESRVADGSTQTPIGRYSRDRGTFMGV